MANEVPLLRNQQLEPRDNTPNLVLVTEYLTQRVNGELQANHRIEEVPNFFGLPDHQIIPGGGDQCRFFSTGHVLLRNKRISRGGRWCESGTAESPDGWVQVGNNMIAQIKLFSSGELHIREFALHRVGQQYVFLIKLWRGYH